MACAPDLEAAGKRVIADMQRWLERAVIGLNLCPFAKAVHAKRQIRYVVSDARDQATLSAMLAQEAELLVSLDQEKAETTLLIHPHALVAFDDYVQYLDTADTILRDLGLEGTLQIASFHPDYRFAGTTVDDITNCTNRSPYPMLHLLREASVDRAVEAFPDAAAIYERNIDTLRKLGAAGWHRTLNGEAT